jgi:hypothetical protein
MTAEVLMAKTENPVSEPQKEDSSEFNRAPRQKKEHRNPVDSAEKTKHVPTKHGAIK